MRLREEGVRPAVVLARQAQDAAHLTARGITELIDEKGADLARAPGR